MAVGIYFIHKTESTVWFTAAVIFCMSKDENRQSGPCDTALF